MNNKPDYIWKYYAYSGLSGLAGGIYLPIWILLLLDKGFNMATIGLFSGVMNFSMFALEIPTGIVADKISRKWSVSLGLIFQGISAFTIVTSANFVLILIGGFIFFGLGMTLRSGADSALIYDSMKFDGLEDTFHKTIGNSLSLTFLGTVAGNLLCGVIVGYTGLSGPYVAGLTLFFLSATFPALIHEPPFLVEARTDNVSTFRFQMSSYFRHANESLRFVGGSRVLVCLVFINLVIMRMALQPLYHFSQPYLRSFAYSAEQISYFWAIFNVISALFAKFSASIKKLMGGKERRVFLLIVFFGAASLLVLINAPIGVVAVLAFSGLNLTIGLFSPFIQDSLNRRIPSEKRASCLSIVSAGQSLIGVVSMPLFGYFIDTYSMRTGLVIFQWTFLGLLSMGVVWGWSAFGEKTDPRFLN